MSSANPLARRATMVDEAHAARVVRLDSGPVGRYALHGEALYSGRPAGNHDQTSGD
jgi:hypothetical protein